ncbi:unnamed protein product [Effrenium voratum]|uniref:DAGKc domain-containing protein n=1 Tax=Effrenium voratum TaxID=2562239 RepID=A0AA36MNS7_9DINO|nr:unnamed protein product [Effrenium voratum]
MGQGQSEPEVEAAASEPASELPMLLSDVTKADVARRQGLTYKAKEPDSFADFSIVDDTPSDKAGPSSQAQVREPSVEKKDSLESRGRQPTDAEKKVLRQFREHWSEQQGEIHRVARHQELKELLEHTHEQMRTGGLKIDKDFPSNRYGVDTRLPHFDKDKHVPVLALINPFAGAMAGSDILAIARCTPYYQDRFFNIIDVVKDQRRGGLLDLLRLELCAAAREAKAMGARPRIISGGGDGTASFTLFILFAALRADNTRADEGLKDTGNGFIWTDEEMAESFPALAQMPLGSANDCGRTLGWGRKYPGDAESRFKVNWRKHARDALLEWIEAAISKESMVTNFDIFGIVPKEGEETCNFKLAELGGHRGMDPKVHLEGEKHLAMKEAGLPVPLFICLYFSAGFGAYMTARFQMNRRKSPIRNKVEYFRQAAGILLESVPPQLNVGLDKVQIFCGNERYFPPRSEDGSGGERYREVGFLNINWQAGMFHGAERAPLMGRMCSSREPARFNDGMMDMYRGKFKSVLKNPGLVYQTDKREEGLTLTYSGEKGTGVFFQWDGESRFAFSPTGEEFQIHVRQMMNIPVVLGPNYDRQVAGDPDNGQPVKFSFTGKSEEERRRYANRILTGVQGLLNKELLASKEEMRAVGLQEEDDFL